MATQIPLRAKNKYNCFLFSFGFVFAMHSSDTVRYCVWIVWKQFINFIFRGVCVCDVYGRMGGWFESLDVCSRFIFVNIYLAHVLFMKHFLLFSFVRVCFLRLFLYVSKKMKTERRWVSEQVHDTNARWKYRSTWMNARARWRIKHTPDVQAQKRVAQPNTSGSIWFASTGATAAVAAAAPRQSEINICFFPFGHLCIECARHVDWKKITENQTTEKTKSARFSWPPVFSSAFFALYFTFYARFFLWAPVAKMIDAKTTHTMNSRIWIQT